jgi:chromosome segregation protein
LQQVRETLAVKEQRAIELEEEISQIRNSLLSEKTKSQATSKKLEQAHQEVQRAQNELFKKDSALVDAVDRQRQVDEALAGRSHDDTEFDELRLTCDARLAEIGALKVEMATALTAKMEMEVLEFGAREQRDVARESLDRLREELAELQAEKAADREELTTQMRDSADKLR